MANMGYDDQHPPATTPGAISERGVATPWNEDYEFPASVGPVGIKTFLCEQVCNTVPHFKFGKNFLRLYSSFLNQNRLL